jgi:flagellar protein FlbD
MIVATRPNHSQFAVNPDLIERIHVNPDTTLVLVDGSIFTVTETMAEVIERIAAYRARVIAIAHGIPESVADRAAGVRSVHAVPEPSKASRPVELDRVRERRLERVLAGGR